MAHTASVTAATDVPVSVDLENGYGPEPEDAALAITRVAAAGAVGGSIEDFDRDGGRLYDISHAADRITAAAEAARALDVPFMLTGRAENHIRDNPDLDDTIARLQAYEAAGADVLYAPGLATVDEIRAVCSSVSRPVNVLGFPGFTIGRDLRGGRPAGERRWWPDLGRRGGHGRRRHHAPGDRRLLSARRRGSARSVVRLGLAGRPGSGSRAC